MFGLGKDKGQVRSFEYEDEYTVDEAGRMRRSCPLSLQAETRQVLAEAFYVAAKRLNREAAQLNRHGESVVEAQAFQAIISGS